VHEVLNMTVREAITFFREVPKITNRLRVLDEVGLGYLRLGQSATTLSGGEAQRIKLAAQLSKRTGQRHFTFSMSQPQVCTSMTSINCWPRFAP
jgi:excinuclease ABC subunit A